MNEHEELMTVSEVAKKLRISESTVYNFANRGVLPAVKMGKVVRFSPEAVWGAVEKMQLKAYGKAA